MKFYCLDILIRWQGLLLMRKGKFQSSEIGNLFKSQTEIHWQETRDVEDLKLLWTLWLQCWWMRLELLLIKLMLKTPSMYPSSSPPPFFEIFDFTLEISAASAAASSRFLRWSQSIREVIFNKISLASLLRMESHIIVILSSPSQQLILIIFRRKLNVRKWWKSLLEPA